MSFVKSINNNIKLQGELKSGEVHNTRRNTNTRLYQQTEQMDNNRHITDLEKKSRKNYE